MYLKHFEGAVKAPFFIYFQKIVMNDEQNEKRGIEWFLVENRMDESKILRTVLESVVENERLMKEQEAEANGESFDIDKFIVELLLVGTANIYAKKSFS